MRIVNGKEQPVGHGEQKANESEHIGCQPKWNNLDYLVPEWVHHIIAQGAGIFGIVLFQLEKEEKTMKFSIEFKLEVDFEQLPFPLRSLDTTRVRLIEHTSRKLLFEHCIRGNEDISLIKLSST